MVPHRVRRCIPSECWLTRHASDDDTYILSLDAISRMLDAYDHTKPVLVGANSEFTTAMRIYGGQAFGGAGMFISRELMSRVNKPGRQRVCRSLFRTEFGGELLPASTDRSLMTVGQATA